MAIHVAEIVPVIVLANGSKKLPSDTLTIAEKMTSNTEFRIKQDSAIPSSNNYPTVKEYLILEDAANFRLSHMNQSFVVTYGT
jgi:hypothetical protein